jgi:poly(3-hydroxybutyrate) depolymerase
MHRLATILLLAAAAAPLPAAAQAVSAEAPLAGKGDFLFTGWAGPPIRIFYQLPPAVKPDTPVLIAVHGVNRDANVYRDAWARMAVERGFIVVAPEFSKASFPDNESFSSGGITLDGKPQPRERWTFSAIDPLFAAIKARTGTKVPRYVLYGHSGGAQFVQRFVLMMPEARYARAIAANAGWYTMPDLASDLPYGLRGSPVDEAGLKAALGRPLWILLGSKDVDPRSPELRTTREAMKQGPYRLARGDSFYTAGKDVAARLGTPFGWQRRYVNGVGHDNDGMAAAAVALVAPKPAN